MQGRSHTSNILALGDNATLQQLAQHLEQQQKTLYCFNPLSIVPLDWQKNSSIPWQEIDIVIAVSAHAVHYGLNLALSLLPQKTLFFAIGSETANKMNTNQSIIVPPRYNSESLLELPLLQKLKGEKIALFKGQGGRTLLPQTLQKRGGILYTIDCYERQPLTIDLTKQLRFWQTHQVDQLILSSLSSLHAFLDQVPKEWQDWLNQLTWIVTSARLEDALRQLGFNKIKRAEQFSVSAIQSVLL